MLPIVKEQVMSDLVNEDDFGYEGRKTTQWWRTLGVTEALFD